MKGLLVIGSWAFTAALLVAAAAMFGVALGGCAGFGSAKAPDATTTVTAATATAAQSHKTTPASKTVTTERVIEVDLPPAPVAPEPPLAPGGALEQPPPQAASPAGAGEGLSLLVTKRMALLSGYMARAIALAPAMLASAEPVTIGGAAVSAPPGSTIRVKDSTTTTTTDSGLDARATASGSGAGLTTNSPSGAAGFETTAPAANLPTMPGAAKGAATGGASGGDAEASVTWKGLTIPGTSINLFQIIGCVLLLGAVGVFVAGRGFPGVGLLTGPLAGVLAAVGGASLALGFLLESPWWVKALVIGVPVAGGVILLVPRVRKLAKELEAKAQSEKTIDDLNKVVNAAVVGIETGDATGDVKRAVHLASTGWRDDVDRVVQRVLREAGFGYGAASDAAKKPVPTPAPASAASSHDSVGDSAKDAVSTTPISSVFGSGS